MAHKIRTDLQIDTLAGSGTRPLAVNSAGIVIEQTATDKTEGTRLATVDMTNGGANNLRDVDVVWQSAWDSYDYVEILVRSARNTVVSQNAWVAFANGTPSTYLTLVGYGSSQGVAWSSDNLPANTAWHGSVNMTVYAHQKILATGKSGFAIDAAVKVNSPANSTNGLYRCSVTSGSGAINTYDNIPEHSGWYTGSAGFDGYTLRLAQESGAFNNGTISVIGYKYP